MDFTRRRQIRLDTLYAALSGPRAARALDRLKAPDLTLGDQSVQLRELAAAMTEALDPVEGTRPGLDEPDCWWETD